MSNASELGRVTGAVTLIKLGASPHNYMVAEGGQGELAPAGQPGPGVPFPKPRPNPNSPFNQRANETGTPFDPDFRPSGHQAAPRSDPQSVHAYREGGALQSKMPSPGMIDRLKDSPPIGDLPSESFMTPEEVAPLSPQDRAQNAERARQQILTPTARPVQRQAATPLAQSATPAPPMAGATMSSSPLQRGNMPGGAPSAASPAPPMPKQQPSMASPMGSLRADMPEDMMSLDQIESQDMARSAPTPAPPVRPQPQRVSARGFGAGGPIRNIVGARRQNVAQGTTRRDMRQRRRGR